MASTSADVLGMHLAEEPSRIIEIGLGGAANSQFAPVEEVGRVVSAFMLEEDLAEATVSLGLDPVLDASTTLRVHRNTVDLSFDDGSYASVRISSEPASDGLDEGLALLEPITRIEHASIERLLALIWQAAANDVLTEAQERMIVSIALMIEQEQREAQPGETERYGPVAVVRRAFRVFMSGEDVVKNALAWSQVIEILYEIGWRVTAKQLGG